jgi:hypothetical protein
MLDSAFSPPRLRNEVIGLGLDLGSYRLSGGSISVDHSLESVSRNQLACPPKPCLVPILDAAPPSPIVSLPSPVIALGLGTSQRMPTKPAIWPTPFLQQLTLHWPSPSNFAVVDIQEQKPSLTSSAFDLPETIDNEIELTSPDRFSITDDCMINQQHTLDSASGNTGGPLIGSELGISLPLPELRTSDHGAHKIEQTSLPIIHPGPGGPLSQAIAFASIPFYSAQPCPKKSATGLGLGRPASLGRRPRASQLASISRLSFCVTEKGTPRCNSNTSSPCSPFSPSRRRIIAGARRLLKPPNFINRRLYAIPEVVSPTCASPIGMSAGRINLLFETREKQPRISKKRTDSTCMTSHRFTSDDGITAHLPQFDVRPGKRLSRSGSPKSPKSLLNHDSTRKSPVLIRLDVPQKLNFMKRRQSGANAWSGLRSLF